MQITQIHLCVQVHLCFCTECVWETESERERVWTCVEHVTVPSMAWRCVHVRYPTTLCSWWEVPTWTCRGPETNMTWCWNEQHQSPLNMCARVKHVRKQQRQLAHTSGGETLLIPVGKVSHYSSNLITAVRVRHIRAARQENEWKLYNIKIYRSLLHSPKKQLIEHFSLRIMQFWHVYLVILT